MSTPKSSRSRFLGPEPCPNCRKQGKDTRGDNLQRWEDHAHCFSCEYHEYPDGKKEIKKLMERIDSQTGEIVNTSETRKVLTFPDDAEKTISVKAVQWLDRYGIMRGEIIENGIQWSQTRQWLLFPIRGDEGMIGFQARNFGDSGPKWESRGDLASVVHLINKSESDGPVIIVEDIISAIKVGRQFCAMPIFGSTVGIRRLHMMRNITKEIVFWLDADKYPEAIRMSNNVGILNIKGRVVYTQNDPKEYSDKEIDNIVNSAIAA